MCNSIMCVDGYAHDQLHWRLPRMGAAVESIAKRFGVVLRRRREAVKVSQEDLAAKADLHRNYVGLLERGKQIPSILVVEKLAKALDTTMASLMREVEKD